MKEYARYNGQVRGKIMWAVILITATGLAAAGTTKTPRIPRAENNDEATIKSFMGKPNMELTYVNTDLPTPYFRVGKITKVDGGENMEAIDGWIHRVKVYRQKEVIQNNCSVYEYHIDETSHTLAAVIIKGLNPDESEAMGIICPSPARDTKITKTEAQAQAWEYLKRSGADFDQLEKDLVYTQQQNGEAHEWIWEDRNYKLPDGLGSRPYPYPIIRISVYGKELFQYWNTTALFETSIEAAPTRTTAERLRDCLPKSDMASKEACDRIIQSISTFEECVNAGMQITESPIRKCTTPDGRVLMAN